MTDIQDNAGYVPEQEEVTEHLDAPASEQEEGAPSEQPFDEYQTEKSAEQPKKHRVRDKITALHNNVWHLLEENRAKDERLRQLEAEKVALGEQLQQSANIALNHYDNSANLRVDQAKQRLIAAEETGDVIAKADAIAEMAEAKAEAQRAREWKAQSSLREQSYRDAAAAPAPTPAPIDERFGQAWVQNNSWYNPGSHDYQPLLAEPVRKYASQLDYQLHNSGQGHLIYSPQYFQEIESYAHNVGEGLLKNRGLNMQQGNNTVASVNRNGAGAQGTGRISVRLTEDDKAMAKRFGVKEEDYVKYKAKEASAQRSFGRDFEMAKRNGRF
jgi:hypothetical protein